MSRHYFSQTSDVKHVVAADAAQRITRYHVSLDGKRHEVPATHRDILQILRQMMRQNSQNAEVHNG